MKTIEITVDAKGGTTGRDQGLHRRRVPGGEPVRRTGPRPPTAETLTAAFYQGQQAGQEIRQSS